MVMLATVKYRNNNFKIKSKINLSTVFVHCDGHYNKSCTNVKKKKQAGLIFEVPSFQLGFPGGSGIKNLPAVQETQEVRV